MFSSTLIVRTTTLISLFLKYMMPVNNMVLESRVLALDNLTDLIRQVLNRIGTPLHAQSLEFIWRSGVQALYLLEAHLFPEQTPQTPTELATPTGDPHSFRFLLHDVTFQAHIDSLLPSWNSLLQFSDFLHQAREALNVPAEIIQAIYDATLVLENLGLVFNIDFCTTQSNAAQADVGGTADNASSSTAPNTNASFWPNPEP